MTSIPKIIMQTWKNREIPKEWSKSPESIKDLMSDWKYVLMTDKDMDVFVQSNFPDFYPHYRNFPHNIQRCDAFRYMWLYKVGGVYIDLDFELKESLENLLKKHDDGVSEAFIALSGNNNNWYTNSFLASRPGCRIWLECLQEIKNGTPWWAIGKHFEVMYSAGPGMLTRVLAKTKTSYFTVPSRDITPCNICEMPCTKEGSYVNQLCGGSWYAWDTVIYNFLFCKLRYVIAVVVIIILLLLYWFLNRK